MAGALGAVALFSIPWASASELVAQTGVRSTIAQSAGERVLPDPAIRRGVLPNGLRYFIMQSATPKGSVSLRLGMEVGTYDEGPGDHGVAHFVEHMAFNFGETGHEEGPESAFAAAGVEFGRDQNAETETFKTNYRLDMPHSDAASLDLAFNWLRGVAREGHFTEAAVDRERGIILAERDTRHTPELKAYEATEQFLAPGLASTRANVIGTPNEIRSIDASRVQDFYRRWYRPENAIFVVVGDIDPDAIEQRIRAAFADWTNGTPPPPPRTLQSVDESRGLDVQTIAEPHLAPQLSICRVRKPDPAGPDDIARVRRAALTLVWAGVLNTRLSALAKSDAPPFLTAQSAWSDNSREFVESCVAVSLLDRNWQSGLAAAEAQLRRMQETPPTREEVTAAVENLRASYRGGMQGAATRPSDQLATFILDEEAQRKTIASPVESFRDFDLAVDGLSPKDVQDAFAHDWSGSGPLITVVVPKPPDATSVREAWRAGAGTPLAAAPLASARAPWSYESFGPVGHIVSREEMRDPDFVRVTFANGVVLNFKHTEFEKGEAKVRVHFGAGRRELANDDYVRASVASSFFKLGGVGRHDYEDIQQIFLGWGWDVALDIKDDAFVLKGDTTTGGLRIQLPILAAYVSDPGFRRSVDVRLPSYIDAFYRQYRANPSQVLGTGLPQMLKPGGPLTMPSESELEKLRMADLERYFKPALANAPIEVTIVGDANEAVATELVAETFGALPQRQAASRARPDTFFMRFPETRLPAFFVTHDGQPEQAMFSMSWPLYVATPERRREEVALVLASRVFDSALRHRIRQELGKSYAPSVDLYAPDRADQAYIQAAVETSLMDLDDLLIETRSVARKIANGEFSDAEIESARKPLVANLLARESTNAWWLDGLVGSSVNQDGLNDMRTYRSLVSVVTAAEVRKAAATWLSHAPFLAIATPSARRVSANER